MKYFLVITFLLVSCSHKPMSHFEQAYPEVSKDIPLDTEFGFILDNTEYNFGRVRTQKGDTVCDYFLGYKNRKLTYQFSTFQQETLIKIFQTKKDLNKKTRAILAEIEKINLKDKSAEEKQKTSCMSMSRYRSDAIGYGIVFSPFIVILSPVIIPQGLMDEYQKSEISKKIKSVSLGQSSADAERLLGTPVRNQTREGYKVLSYAWTAYSAVFANYIFEDDKLVGFIAGFDSRPQTVIEQTK